jgi:hypothetical protein
MRYTLLLGTLLITGCQRQALQEGQVNSMPADVQRVHARMLDAMGGRDAWQRARYFEFDFVPVRQGQEAARWRHRWDRHTGDFRVSGLRGQDSVVVISNTNTPTTGRVWVNRQEVTGPRADSLLRFGFGRWTNDSYWLIMPYKWTDPGVHTQYLGSQTDDKGMQWEVVKLWFDQVGLTPQNQYHAFINPSTGLMERWYHFPREGANPAMYDWKNWQLIGPIRLAIEKPSLDGASMIRFDNVRVDTRVPSGAFAL